MIPSNRSAIAIAVHRHIRDSNKAAPKQFWDCLLSIALVATLHADDKAVRLAAFDMMYKCDPLVRPQLALIINSSKPVKMVGLILENLNDEKPKRKRGGKRWNRAAKRKVD